MNILENKVVVVTGASSGIGAAVAEAFADAGAYVVVTARRQDRLDALDLKGRGQKGKSLTVAGDITDAALPGAVLDATLAAFGRCDIVFNNAGFMEAGPVAEIDIDKVCAMVRINVEAAYRVAYTFARHFLAVGSGHLINTSSILGTKVRPTAGAYAGTKHAIEALTDGLRTELAKTGVRVSAVAPGLVMTELHKNFQVHPKDGLDIPHPLTPEDVARMVLFIASQPDHVVIPRLSVAPHDQNV